MQWNSSDPTAPTEAHPAGSRHHPQPGQESSSPSSSSSPSPRVSTYIGHNMFDNSVGRRAQGSAGAASTPAVFLTDEDPDPYPLWPRPSTATKAAKPPRRLSSSSSLSMSLISSSSSPRALAPSSSSSSSLFAAPAPSATPNPTPPGAGGMRARKTAPCQYPGCSRNAKYGALDEAPIACQAHKRAGQYTTNRHGEVLRATRDGDAFRTPRALTTSPPPATSASTGKNRPRLSSIDDADDPASKNRSCLFPGCDARPLYGLKGAVRPVYCFSHKKGPMVQLVKEAPKRHDNGGASQSATAAVARKGAAGNHRNKTPGAALAPANGGEKQKPGAPLTAAYKRVAKKTRRDSTEGDDSSDGSGEQHTKGGLGNTQRRKVGSDISSKVTDLTATSDNGRGATTTDAVSPRPSGNTHPAETTGMAPSAEILLLQQAREAAKREAEARGGGRRARAPSRRALEAAGRMTDQGAQWMTQEKKEEQARAAMELREQRKRYRAAGLKAGVVIEEFVVGKADTARVARAAGSGGGRGGGAGGGDSTPAMVVGWRRVSPVALAAPVKQAGAKEQMTPVAVGQKP